MIMTATTQTQTGREFEPGQEQRRFGDAGASAASAAPPREINVGMTERKITSGIGAALILLGLRRGSLGGLLSAGLGGALIYRGVTGHCPMYESLGIDTRQQAEGAPPEEYFKRGIHVEQAFTINRPPEELYSFWRKLDNLPRFMEHLESVTVQDEKRSHWVARGPAGMRIEWDAEIINDEPNQTIAWRSLSGAEVDNAGSVRFVPGRGDRGTEVHIVMDYIPPAGRVGKWVAMLFGKNPDSTIREELRNFKRIMEIGEVPTIQGQPRGTCFGRGKREGEGIV
jgi:uncharacterized membrane protein